MCRTFLKLEIRNNQCCHIHKKIRFVLEEKYLLFFEIHKTNTDKCSALKINASQAVKCQRLIKFSEERSDMEKTK